MSDNTEEKLDEKIPKVLPAEATAKTAHITDADKQQTWTTATEGYRAQKYESGMMEALTDDKVAEINRQGGWQKFQIYDPDAEKNDSTRIFQKAPAQAVAPLPPVSETIRNAPDASPIVLNIQITNVPEVSQAVKPEEALQHLNHVFEAGVQAIRPIEQWLATPNAVNDAIIGIGPALDCVVDYYGNNTAAQVIRDAHGVLEQAGDALNRTFSFPQTSEERAKIAGELMPFVFTDGLGTTGESVTVKTTDLVATNVDAAVLQTIEKSLDAIKNAPDLAAEIKQGLYEFLNEQRLTAQQVEYAGIPRGFFDDIRRTAGKDDNYFSMSIADDSADWIPKRNEGGVEKQSFREKISPSELFVAELNRAVERLEPSIRQYLEEKGINVKPCRRVIDLFPEQRTSAMGCYAIKEKCIYIGEEVQRGESWIKNFDVDFNLRHESGHAFSYTKKGFEQVSCEEKFSLAFAADSKTVPKDILDKLGFDVSTREGREFAREEVFADSFAHATGCPSQNGYSRLIREYFQNCRSYFGGK